MDWSEDDAKLAVTERHAEKIIMNSNTERGQMFSYQRSPGIQARDHMDRDSFIARLPTFQA